MNYVKAKLNWEEVFIQEAIDLEEKMNSLDLSAFNKSRLRLSLENDILSWKKYQIWISAELGCPTISSKLEPAKINEMLERAKTTYEAYGHHPFWNEDLIPVETWDDNVIVFGLEKNEKLIEVPNAIFILAPPEILNRFAEKLFSSNEKSEEISHDSESAEADAHGMLDGINLNIEAPKFDFNSVKLKDLSEEPVAVIDEELPVKEATASMMDPAPREPSSMWDYISERHDEYSFEAKKQFDGYLVLKIVSNRTQVFKLDSDLQKQGFNLQLFDYDLKDENPFKKVFHSENSESFNINQLGFTIRDYKYACITPLKRANTVVGFLVGLKTGNLAESDQTLLEELAKESA